MTGTLVYCIWNGRVHAEKRPADWPGRIVSKGPVELSAHALTEAEMRLSIKELERKFPAPKIEENS